MLELNILGDDAEFEHVGLTVKSIKEAVGDKVQTICDKTQKVSVAFIKINGIKIELIEPFGEDTPISESLKKGQQLVHLCFRVPDIDAAVKKARENGFHCIAKPVPAKAFKNKKITWVFSRIYGLFEVVEG